MTLALWLWLAIAPSFGASYYLETPPTSDKAAATELSKTASGAGSSRVVRRYAEGAGWQYVVVVEGFTEQKAAETAADSLATKGKTYVQVFVMDGAEARRVSTAGTSGEPPPVVQIVPPPAVIVTPPPPAITGTPEGAALLTTAIASARPIAEDVRAARAIAFSYRRTVPDGTVAKHLYAARGDDRYLEVAIEKGPGVPSTSGIAGGSAWLDSAGVTSREDLARTREMLGRFAPDAVLSLLFTLPTFAGEAAVVTGIPSLSQRSVDVGGARLDLDEAGHLVRATWKDGGREIVQEFTDWRDDHGRVVPHRIKTWRAGDLVDDVEVLSLDLSPKVDEKWFRAPAP